MQRLLCAATSPPATRRPQHRTPQNLHSQPGPLLCRVVTSPPRLVIPSPLIELSAEGQCGGGEGGGRGDSAAAGGERRTLRAAAPPGLRGPCGGSGPPVPGEGHDFGNFSEPGHPQQGDSPSVSTATGIKYNLQRARSPRSHPSIARPPERPPRLLPFDLKPTQPSQSP